MSDYSQGKIYILKSKNTEDVYIGSTTLSLQERFHFHMSNYYRWLRTNNNYITSIEIIKQGEPYIELLQDYSCNSQKELRRKEGEYQLKIKCVNKNVAGRSIKEYNSLPEVKERRQEYEKNRPCRKEQRKEYRKKNRDEINERNKKLMNEYRSRPEVKEQISEWGKEYRSRPEVKEHNKKQSKEYRNRPEVKKRLSEKKKQTFKCICGSEITIVHKRRHEKTRKHIQYIEEIKEKGDSTNINEFIEHITTN